MIHSVLFQMDGKHFIEDIRMGMAKVGERDYSDFKFAILNKEGVYITEFCYDMVGVYSEGYVAAANNIGVSSNEKGIQITKAKYGLLDMEGNVVIPFEYQELGMCKEGLINAKKDGKWGFLTSDGEEKIPFIYDEAHCFSEGLAAVKKDGKFGFIDRDGNVVINFNYIWTHDFSDGVCFVQDKYASADSSLIYINKKGEVDVTINKETFGKYGMPSNYNEGVMVLNQGKVISKDGSVQFELGKRYRMKHFKDGLSCVHDIKTDKYGYVNTEGKFVVPCQFEDCYTLRDNNVEDGMIGVQNNNMWGVINSKGNTILPTEYNSICGYSDGRIIAIKDNTVYNILVG